MAGIILNTNLQQVLRTGGHMSQDEIASIHGDLLVAENVKTGERRILEMRPTDLQENKRILKG